jgi:hypothetical protein
MSKRRELSDYLDDDPMQIILADPGFRDSLLATMAKIQSGETKWSGYDEVLVADLPR